VARHGENAELKGTQLHDLAIVQRSGEANACRP
jgi:hypothetical protein